MVAVRAEFWRTAAPLSDGWPLPRRTKPTAIWPRC